jgi:MbtH protein
VIVGYPSGRLAGPVMIGDSESDGPASGQRAIEMSVFDDEDGTTVFKVLANGEEQYSLWPAIVEIPDGWYETGRQGSKAECCAYINEIWPDIRPRSVRER